MMLDRNAAPPAPRPPENAMYLALPVTHKPYGTVTDLELAVELAGPDGVRLTELSRRLGQRQQLVLAPDTRTVIWATEQPDGQWVTEELPADRALMRVPARYGGEAPHEYRLLLRATLDERSSVLPAQIDQMISDLQERLVHLSAVRDELLSVN